MPDDRDDVMHHSAPIMPEGPSSAGRGGSQWNATGWWQRTGDHVVGGGGVGQLSGGSRRQRALCGSGLSRCVRYSVRGDDRARDRARNRAHMLLLSIGSCHSSLDISVCRCLSLSREARRECQGLKAVSCGLASTIRSLVFFPWLNLV